MPYYRSSNTTKLERTTCLNLNLESASKVQKQKKTLCLKSYRFHSVQGVLMLLETCMAAFDLLILQGFHIKQEELIS
jgi:hypothetical protein